MKSKTNKIAAVIAIVFISTLAFVKCSSSVPQKEIGEVEPEIIYKDEIRLNVKSIISWINAMPGSKPRFHVTGELEILDNSNYDFKHIKITGVTILQDQKMVFMFRPKIMEELDKNKKTLTFSTIKGLLLNAGLNKKKAIDVVFDFYDGSTEIKYVIKNVHIEIAV